MGSAPNCNGNGNGKMGIIAADCGVHTVTAKENKIDWCCLLFYRSMNEPLSEGTVR